MKSLVGLRTNAGDGAVVLAQLVADVYRIVLDCNIEVVESHNQQDINNEI